MTTDQVTVEQASVADHELVEAISALLSQLSSSAPPPTFAELDEVATSPATTLFVARNASGRIVGALTLAHFRLPTGVRAWIEDVVVDQAERGIGIGSALVEAAVDAARQAGARTVDLTSRPDREAANRLYQRLGFVRRETNVYRYAIDGA
ncbi:MAG TPA: GNAT family N-acetyltransferase [Acidimicrobiales bacterium]